PLRKIRKLVRDVLGELNRSLSRLYASEGRPSIPPEQLLSALLLQVFYGIRSERQLMEQSDYNLLYRWFVGLSPDDLVWDPTVFTKNRDRLQSGEVFAKLNGKFRAECLNPHWFMSLDDACQTVRMRTIRDLGSACERVSIRDGVHGPILICYFLTCDRDSRRPGHD